MDKSCEIVTFGCRLNSFESQIIQNNISELGLKDVIIFNSCAVTTEAERQVRQSIRKYRKNHPEKKIIVVGCAVQYAAEKYSKMPEVDLVLGNQEKMQKKFYDPNFKNASEDKLLVEDIMEIKETAAHLVSDFEGKARAFLQIQNGCNHRCTFCMIPFARGNNRSVPMGQLVTEINKLCEVGFNEIVFTGVDITDYGKDLPGTPNLGQMIKRILALTNIKRLRLSSIDVAEINDDLFWLIENEPRLMPHFHISLQAGDDMILKRMKRRHLRHQILEFCEKVRKLRPNVAFGADMIAGFPTETDEMFQNSLNLISEANLQYLHIFPYSQREGTPAARMPQVEGKIRKERAAKLRQAGQESLNKFHESNIGKIFPAIAESQNIARTENFIKVRLENAENLKQGSLFNVKLTKNLGSEMQGEIVS